MTAVCFAVLLPCTQNSAGYCGVKRLLLLLLLLLSISKRWLVLLLLLYRSATGMSKVARRVLLGLNLKVHFLDILQPVPVFANSVDYKQHGMYSLLLADPISCIAAAVLVSVADPGPAALMVLTNLI